MITLVFVPVVYSLFEGMRSNRKAPTGVSDSGDATMAPAAPAP
jgi:hypothetical protein